MLKKMLVGLCVSAFLAAPVSAQQLDVSELTDYEKSLHRWAWCVEVDFSATLQGLQLGNFKTIGISNLLSDNNRNSRENDPRRIYRRASQDTEAALLLGQIEITEEVLEKCESDMLTILGNEYVPNFTYLE